MHFVREGIYFISHTAYGRIFHAPLCGAFHILQSKIFYLLIEQQKRENKT